MRVLKNTDLQGFKQIVSLKQPQLLTTLKNILEKSYKDVVATKDYIYAIGDIPIALVAHMDTVFPTPPSNIYYDSTQGVIWSPYGLGADDRAGIFAILKIIARGYRPHIIFTNEEEVGGLGAMMLTDIKSEPFAPMKYIIELDRRGTSDCVFYSCDNKDFIKYIESFGFIEAFGTFSDISEICPAWKVAGVNLSIGYVNEHSCSEMLYVEPMLKTIDRVCRMLKDVDNSQFWKYIPGQKQSSWLINSKEYNDYWYNSTSFGDIDEQVICEHCGKVFYEYESYPVLTTNNKIKYYCIDCIGKQTNIDWCNTCGEAYELTENSNGICHRCKSKVKVVTGK